MEGQKITRQRGEGKCYLCNGTFNKAAMTKHLQSCQQRKGVSVTPSDNRRSRKTKLFHLVVEGRYRPEYWMHLETPANVTLKYLDAFLRDIWLECCGHLSAFTIGGKTYMSHPEIGERGMNVALANVLTPKMKFYHEYDFGTTTHLVLKVVSEQEAEIKGKSIQILARNEFPLITCEMCGNIATQVCTECIWSGKGWLCDECASKHGCGEEMLLPVVNSPRIGMCGYTG